MRSVPRVPSILSIGSPRLDRVRVVDARSASPPPRWVNAGTATARARVAARARSTSARPTWPRRRSSAARAASSAAAAPRNCSAAPEPRGIASFGSGCVRRGGVTFVQNVLGGRVSQLRVGASRLPARLMSGGLRGFWPNAPPPLLAICFGTSVHERETGSRARAGDSAETREALRSSSWQAATRLSLRSCRCSSAEDVSDGSTARAPRSNDPGRNGGGRSIGPRVNGPSWGQGPLASQLFPEVVAAA